MKKLKFFAAIMTTALFVVFLCSCTEKNEFETTTESDIEMEQIWSKPDLFEIPSEEEETKVSDNNEEQMLSQIEKARKVYSLFISSKPTLDMNDTLDGADGVVYYRVTDENLDTAEEFKSYLLKYFSQDIVTTLLNIQMYIEDDSGNVYAVDVGMSNQNVTEYVLTSYSEDASHRTAVLRISRDFDADGRTDSAEDITFVMEPVGVDGNWVFTQFSAF